MRQARLPALLALVSVGLGITACGKREEPKDRLPDAAVLPPAPDTQQVVVDVGGDVAALDVSAELQRSRESLARRDVAEAEASLKAAATKLRNAADVRGDALKLKTDAADALDKAANDVKSGSLKTVEAFDRRVADVDAKLARVHHSRAVDAWARRDSTTAGREMAIVADHIEHGTKRLGHDVKTETGTVLHTSRRVGRELAERGHVGAEDVSSAIRGLGREVERLLKDVAEKPR